MEKMRVKNIEECSKAKLQTATAHFTHGTSQAHFLQPRPNSNPTLPIFYPFVGLNQGPRQWPILFFSSFLFFSCLHPTCMPSIPQLHTHVSTPTCMLSYPSFSSLCFLHIPTSYKPAYSRHHLLQVTMLPTSNSLLQPVTLA